MPSGGAALSGQGLDENPFRKFAADGQARVANLANNRGLLAQQAHFLILAETELPQPPFKFGRRRQLADPCRTALAHAVERAEVRTLARCILDRRWMVAGGHAERT
jgi:hypothetical protein